MEGLYFAVITYCILYTLLRVIVFDDSYDIIVVSGVLSIIVGAILSLYSLSGLYLDVVLINMLLVNTIYHIYKWKGGVINIQYTI